MTQSSTGIDWTNLLNTARLEPSTVTEKRTIADEAASDRARVLYSAPLRRLQAKAQVFSMEENASVRSRLTHSLEVAHIGREIARLVTRELCNRKELDAGQAEAIVTMVEVACLVHDIGNPPFGHFGEAAIQQWFSEEAPEVLNHSGLELTDANRHSILGDFVEFDGNPQGFRTLTRLQSTFRPRGGLNLLCSQLLSSVKYPRGPEESKAQVWKKAGYFQSEASLVAQCHERTGLAVGRRHPLAYLMEAADDISYCVSDLEDGIEKGLLDLEKLARDLRDPWEEVRADQQSIDSLDSGEFIRWKAAFTRAFARRAAEYWLADTACHDGTAQDVFAGKAEASFLKSLKDVARSQLFSDKRVEEIELAGFQTITGILRHYSPLLSLSRSDFFLLVSGEPRMLGAAGPVLWRLFHRLPEKHVSAYKQMVSEDRSPCWEWSARAHLVVDYVAGMTDSFAVETHQKLSGIRI